MDKHKGARLCVKQRNFMCMLLFCKKCITSVRNILIVNIERKKTEGSDLLNRVADYVP